MKTKTDIPWVYVLELLYNRTKDAPSRRKAAVYVPDDLYWAYADGVGKGGYTAVEYPEPNILFNNVVIRPATHGPNDKCPTCGGCRCD